MCKSHPGKNQFMGRQARGITSPGFEIETLAEPDVGIIISALLKLIRAAGIEKQDADNL